MQSSPESWGALFFYDGINQGRQVQNFPSIYFSLPLSALFASKINSELSRHPLLISCDAGFVTSNPLQIGVTVPCSELWEASKNKLKYRRTFRLNSASIHHLKNSKN
jgi:hypothetical protein